MIKTYSVNVILLRSFQDKCLGFRLELVDELLVKNTTIISLEIRKLRLQILEALYIEIKKKQS